MHRFLTAVVALAGCGIADFDVSQDVPEQAVQGSNIPAPLGALFPLPLSLDLAQKIKAQNTGPIGTVTLSSLALTITKTDEPAGDTDDWSFVTSVEVFVESTKSGTTLPKVKIASVSAPGAVQVMNFKVENVDVKPYIDEGSQVDTSGTGMVPSDDVSYDGVSTFTVHPL
ncbi:hypothetical protein BH11MYX1_BH11MYX1_14720 [soil metagenome]